MSEPKINSADTDRAVCPWCGYRHEGSWDWEDGDDYCCYECKRPFALESYAERHMTTRRRHTCPDCHKSVTEDAKGRIAVHWCVAHEQYVRCDGSRKVVS